MNIDWDGLEASTYESLRVALAMEHRAFLTGGDDLRSLAVRVVEYWKRALSGEVLGGNLLDAAEHHARALCIYYNIDTKGAPVRLAKLLKLYVLAGEAILKNLGGESRGKKTK